VTVVDIEPATRPLFNIELDFGEEEGAQVDRISVFRGQAPSDLARSFCQKHDISTDSTQYSKIENYLSKYIHKVERSLQVKLSTL